MNRIAFLLACLLFATECLADTELSIVTPRGYVTFTAADHWPVLEMQTKLPATLTVFELPNPAAEGTRNPTNLILQLFERGSEPERRLFLEPVKRYGSDPIRVEQFDGWTITRQDDAQGEAPYVLWDARKTGIADVSVRVRLVWPRIPNYPEGHSEEMDRTFKAFLGSIRGGIGEYKPKDGAVMRRPEQ